jgi:hypothetical protein
VALIGFKKRFAEAVSCGFKRQTVRAMRKHPIRQGETLHLYTGLRQKWARLLARLVCIYAAPVYLDLNLAVVDGAKLSFEERADFAHQDGFTGWAAFIDCIRELHGLPFEGQVIRW